MSRSILSIFPVPIRRRISSRPVAAVLIGLIFVVVGCGFTGGNSDSTAPSVPSNLRGVPGDTEVGLGWDEVGAGDLKEYNVYRSTSTSVTDISGQDPVSTSASASFTDTGLTNGTTYHYVVTAVDDAGNESGPSGSVQKTPGALSRP